MTSKTFNFEKFYSKNSKEQEISSTVHAEYDFAVAYPAPETIPSKGLLQGLERGLEREGKDLAYYPDPFGSKELRNLVKEKLKQDRGIDTTIEEILITHGSGEANNLVIQNLTDPGDTVITEEFVYLGTLSQLNKAEADIVGAKMDDEGIIPEELDNLNKDLLSQGKKIKYLYTIPEFQNPTGSTMPLSRREKVLEITNKYGLPVLEDDCYVDLRFEGETQPSYKSLDSSGSVIHVASFSKLIAPGLRMGYVNAPIDVMKRLNYLKTSGPSQFVSLAIENFLNKEMDSHKQTASTLLREKRDAMISSLGENFGGLDIKWTIPEGGCYLWITFPENVDMDSLQQHCFDNGVGYLSGIKFSPKGDSGHNSARLCFAYESPEKNRAGINKFAEILRQKKVI